MVAWQNPAEMPAKSYVCGHCSHHVGAHKGYYSSGKAHASFLYVCPKCDKPTYFDGSDGSQLPGPLVGHEVDHVPADVSAIFTEARRCTAHSAFTGAVLLCRKLLMHLAVQKGAEENKTFAFYVDYLATNNWLPPGGSEWVTHIKNKGNEANHELVMMKKDDATELLSFLEMLLKFMFEFPARVAKPKPP